MSAKLDFVDELGQIAAAELAEQLVSTHESDLGWLDELQEQIDRRRAGQALARVLEIWDLNQSELAELFGVSRQAVSKWLEHGPPAERLVAIADLTAATEYLVRYLKRDRIGAVVRRTIPAYDDVTLLELVARGETRSMLQACRSMFDFERAMT